jgi:hypothetical protein
MIRSRVTAAAVGVSNEGGIFWKLSWNSIQG